jgi:hypothetical protein
MRKYRVSRFKELIFPRELIIDKFHVLSRKRHFPAFWRVDEESIPLSKLASIQISRGFFFSKIIIENAGGPYPIVVNGLWNSKAHEARDLLEMIEREMAKPGEDRNLETLVEESGGDGNPGGNRPRSEGPQSGGGGPDHDLPPSQPTSDTQSRSKEDSNRPSAVHRASIAGGKRSGKIGEVPENWSPPPPWMPRPKEGPAESLDDSIREVDPVEFLNRTAVGTAVDERKPCDGNAVRSLVNFWDNAKSSAGNSIDGITGWWKRTKTAFTEEMNDRPRPRRCRKLY